MMVMVSKVAKLLGPRGLMPNPRLGSVTMDIGKAVRLAKSGQVSFKTDKGGILHCSVGKQSFTVQQLEENIT